MNRLHAIVLTVALAGLCWLGMQAVHEAGHVLAAHATGGTVRHVELHPLTFSRTDVLPNPHPLLERWGGAVGGVLLPLAAWAIAAAAHVPGRVVLRVFAGFCLIANGAYLLADSFARGADGGDLLRHGAAAWQLWLFGVVTISLGLAMWHGQARQLGLARAARVAPAMAWSCLVGFAALVAVELLFA